MNRGNEVLQALVDSGAKGPDQQLAAMQQLRADLSPDLAAEASRRAGAAAEKGDGDVSLSYYLIASRVYHFVGHHEDSMREIFNYFNILFMLAQTEPEYLKVQTGINSVLAGNPPGHDNPVIGLRARILAADCGFFGCEAAQDNESKKRDLQSALESLVAGATFLEGPGAAQLHPFFASTLVAVCRVCLSHRWTGEPWAAANFAKVTRLLDHAAPGKLTYSEPGKNENIHQGRAELSRIWNGGAYKDDTPPDTSSSGLLGRKLR